MTDQHHLSNVAAEFQRHFDQHYLGVIPRLLNDEGLFLSFVSMLTAIEAIAGTHAPHLSSGERFRSFVSTFFPEIYLPFVDRLWTFRNHMVHSFNPTPFLILCHQSRMHLCAAGGEHMLNEGSRKALWFSDGIRPLPMRRNPKRRFRPTRLERAQFEVSPVRRSITRIPV